MTKKSSAASNKGLVNNFVSNNEAPHAKCDVCIEVVSNNRVEVEFLRLNEVVGNSNNEDIYGDIKGGKSDRLSLPKVAKDNRASRGVLVLQNVMRRW